MWIIFSLTVFSLSVRIFPEASSSPDVDSVVDEFWQWRLEESPEYAIKYGLDVDYSKVEEFTEEAFQRRQNKTDELLDKIAEVDMSGLELRKKNNIKLVKALLVAYKRGFPFRKFSAYNPVSLLTNPITGEWKRNVGRMILNTKEKYEQLIRRYQKMPENINGLIGLMNRAITLKTTRSKVAMGNAVKSIMKEEIPAENSAFFQPFLDKNMHSNVTEPDRTRLRVEAKQAYNEHVLPTITKFRKFVQDVYIPNARTRTGASAMEGGLDYYQECLRWHLTLNITPQQVHDKGLEEVARIQSLMEEIKEKDGFNGTLQEFFAHLKKNKDLFYPTEDKMLAGYKTIVNTAQNKLSGILKNIPKLPLQVTKIQSKTGPTGSYSDPSLDGSRPGVFRANVNNPTKRPKFDMWALTLHESVPGHHTQTAYVFDADLPDFRRAIEFRKYYTVPLNFMFFTAYSEGWALYAEDLGIDMGMYTEKYSLFGKYSGEVFRAGRLVVDTGLHAFGWTPKKARQYLANITTLAPSQIKFEVLRYLNSPGQACSYKIGQLKILELRQLAEQSLGEHFDLKEFHHQILSIGAVPLPMLEDHIKAWIQTVKDKSVSSSSTFLPGAGIIIISYSLITLLIQI